VNVFGQTEEKSFFGSQGFGASFSLHKHLFFLECCGKQSVKGAKTKVKSGG